MVVWADQLTKTQYYDALHQFRLKWGAKGGTRRTLRQARKQQRTLFPHINLATH